MLAGALAIGFAGERGSRRPRRSPLRQVCFLYTAAPLLVLLPPAALSSFDWRYQLPQLALAPVAGVLGITALRRRGRSEDAPVVVAGPVAAADGPGLGHVPHPSSRTGGWMDRRSPARWS